MKDDWSSVELLIYIWRLRITCNLLPQHFKLHSVFSLDNTSPFYQHTRNQRQKKKTRAIQTVRTSSFGRLVVALAHEFLVVHQVELVPCVELLRAHGAREALQVVHVVLRAPHHLCRRDTLFTARALCPKPPETEIGEDALLFSDATPFIL